MGYPFQHVIQPLIDTWSIHYAYQHKESATRVDWTQSVTVTNWSMVPSWIAGCMLLITWLLDTWLRIIGGCTLNSDKFLWVHSSSCDCTPTHLVEIHQCSYVINPLIDPVSIHRISCTLFCEGSGSAKITISISRIGYKIWSRPTWGAHIEEIKPAETKKIRHLAIKCSWCFFA